MRGARTAALSMMVALAAAPACADEAADRALAEQSCGRCHAFTVVLAKRFTRAQWEVQIEIMLGRGAQVADADFDRLAEYLATHAGSGAGEAQPPGTAGAPTHL
jgi:hypothetical protein